MGVKENVQIEPAAPSSSYLSLSMKCNCLVENKTNVINVSGTCWWKWSCFKYDKRDSLMDCVRLLQPRMLDILWGDGVANGGTVKGFRSFGRLEFHRRRGCKPFTSHLVWSLRMSLYLLNSNVYVRLILASLLILRLRRKWQVQ